MRWLASVAALVLVAAACSETATTPEPAPQAASAASPSAVAPALPDIIPILVSSELAIGDNRFLFGLVDRANEPLAAPEVAISLAFYDLDVDADAVVFETDARFLWAIEDLRGLYAADVSYPDDGRWATRFFATFPDGTIETARVEYDVRETTSTPPLGSTAPSVETPTAADVDGELAAISTDTEPLARLYDLSIADALAAGEPFVVAFVTPAFCQTATCGPTLEKVKAVAMTNPELSFIHVEPYVMAVQDGRLQPVLDDAGFLQAAGWTTAWGLLTEPFVAVVAGDGDVRAKFEGAITTAELEQAIAAL